MEKRRRASQSHREVQVGEADASGTANGRATTRPLFSSRSGGVEERVRRARRRRRRRRSHHWTARGKARPELLRLGERQRRRARGGRAAGPSSPGPGRRLREPGRQAARGGGDTRRPAPAPTLSRPEPGAPASARLVCAPLGRGHRPPEGRAGERGTHGRAWFAAAEPWGLCLVCGGRREVVKVGRGT